MRRASVVVVVVLAALVLGACRSGCRAPSIVHITTHTGSAILYVDVAKTDQQLERGLAGRDDLPDDQGMAFVFGHDTGYSFWMKDVTIPLSIAFWDRRGRIVDILPMKPCAAEPCRRYRSATPYVGALETNRGYFRTNAIHVGDRIRLEERPCP